MITRNRRVAPDGVTITGRSFSASHSKGFMLAESVDTSALFRFTSEWASLIDFTIEPVLSDEQAGEVLNSMSQAKPRFGRNALNRMRFR